MTKYTYNISVSATDEKSAEKKMKAISVISSKLSEKELVKLADIIQNDPAKTAMAKRALGV